MRKTPYAWARGVLNVRVSHSEEDATLADLRERFKEPVALMLQASEYHAGTKRTRGDVKKALPYFVGGTINGKRHDTNVAARTLLTLDIEASGTQDEQPPPPQDVLDSLEALGAEGWVYTSLSHQPDAPRYRVVLPLGEHLEGDDLTLESLKASTKNAARKLGIDEWCTPESWVLSQPMYLPAKLRGGKFWEGYTPGKAWKPIRKATPADIPGERIVADIPDAKYDPVLVGLRRAGLYLHEDKGHPGKHYITCPWHADHGAVNDTQTVYYEAHHDGNPRPAVKCFDTEPDEHGHPHLTYKGLVNWLRDNGHITSHEEDDNTSSAMDEYDIFLEKASVGQYLDDAPVAREFAWDKFAPVGKVTVLAGPGGVSKSMLMLHLLAYGAMGQSWGGFKVQGPLRGIYVSYEDDKQELHKRVHGLAEAIKAQDGGLGDALYDVKGLLQKNLLLYAADDEALRWLLMTKPDMRGAPERTARVEWLVGFVRHARMKVLVLDPVVYTHTLEENNSQEMSSYMQMLNYIAKAADCAVVVLHHMAKTAQWATLEEIHQGSIRGASAFADNSRSVGVMVGLPPKDAARYGMAPEQAREYAVFKHAKHNYSASMGVCLFERKGPLLIPREDLVPLSHAEANAAAEEQKHRQKSVTLEAKAYVILSWLEEQHGEPATGGMLRNSTGIRYTLFKEALKYAEESDWVKAEPGINRSMLYSITKTGAKWLSQRESEAMLMDRKQIKKKGQK
jgi:hypothetical protein